MENAQVALLPGSLLMFCAYAAQHAQSTMSSEDQQELLALSTVSLEKDDTVSTNGGQ